MQETIQTDEDLLSHRHFGIEEAIFIILVLLSLVGISITDFPQHDGYGYWLIMVFVFGGLSILVSWLQSKSSEQDFTHTLKLQAMHWLHTLIIVGAAFLLNKSGQLSEAGATQVILLILALSTMLDGYRIGWQFSLLGFFLMTCSVIVTHVEQFTWACTALGLAVVVTSLLWTDWIRKQASYADD